MQENIRIHPIHQFNVVLRYLKWSFLETEVAWRTAHDEAEVNMDYVPLVIDQNIVIVPIFNLKQVLDDRVSC